MAHSRGEIIGGIIGVTVGVLLLVVLASLLFNALDSTPPAKAPTVGASPCASVNFDPAHLCPSP